MSQDIITKNQIILSLSELENQIQDIKRMIIDKVPCNDILNQVSSIQSELISVNRIMLKNHVIKCLLKDTSLDKQEVTNLLIMIDLITK